MPDINQIKEDIHKAFEEARQRYIHEAITILVSAGTNKDDAKALVESLLSRLPHLNRCTYFLPGIVRWFAEGQIDLHSDKDLLRLDSFLYAFYECPLSMDYDGNFAIEGKPVAFDTLCKLCSLDIDSTYEGLDELKGHSYSVVRLRSFADTDPYRKYAPYWCIFQDEATFRDYTMDGENRLYIVLRDDYKDVPAKPGRNLPRDAYGVSIICVIVNPKNQITTMTTRWNSLDEEERFMSNEELRGLIGDDAMKELFCKMKILQISDTHGLHHQLTNLPPADVIVHCGDFTDMGNEDEVLDFLNWFIDLPYAHKIFVTGNHDFCLWDAVDIEDLPENVYFLQDRGCVIDGIKFYGLAFNHPEKLIPEGIDVLVTHEPPDMILDLSDNAHWGNLTLRKRVMEVRPKCHLFGHAHPSNGILRQDGILFSNAALIDNFFRMRFKPRLINLK